MRLEYKQEIVYYVEKGPLVQNMAPRRTHTRTPLSDIHCVGKNIVFAGRSSKGAGKKKNKKKKKIGKKTEAREKAAENSGISFRHQRKEVIYVGRVVLH